MQRKVGLFFSSCEEVVINVLSRMLGAALMCADDWICDLQETRLVAETAAVAVCTSVELGGKAHCVQ